MSRADFIEMTTVSIAGTAGNGAVTMSAATGLPTFTNVFGASTRLCDYVIEDTVALKFEKGYGSISSGVLTRSNVQETWDGTTYLSVNAVALAFGSTPTSGNVRVRMAPTADAFIPVPPAIQKTIGASTYLNYQASAHLSVTGTPANTGVIGSTLEYYAPYLSITRGKVDGFGFNIGIAGSTGIKAALYEVGIDGLPGPCITQFNAISTNAVTGFQADTTPGTWGVNAGPIRLGVGWFYIGYMANDATVAIKRVGSSSTNNSVMLVPPTGLLSDGYGYGATLSKTIQGTYAGGMPSGTPTGTFTLNNGAIGQYNPLLFLKINNA